MTTLVTLHPYFRPHEGKFDEFVASLPSFVEKTSTEPKCLFYDFTVGDGVIFCREGYDGAEAALGHLDNVGEMLQEALEISDLERLEIHGPAAEIDKMREPLKELPVRWFVRETGVEK